MKIPSIAFYSLNHLLKLQTGLVFKVSRQTIYNYSQNGVPPDRFAALLFCLLAHGVGITTINRTLQNCQCPEVINYTLDQLTEISF